MRARWPCLAVLAIALVASRDAVAQHAFEVGKPFPSIALPSLDGEPMSIVSFRGKRVVLIVFASW